MTRRERGRQPRGRPPGRQRALDGCRVEVRAAGRDVYRDLPGDLGRHAHRLRRPRVQHRPRRRRAAGDRCGPDRPQQGGKVTEVAFGLARGLDYLSIALFSAASRSCSSPGCRDFRGGGPGGGMAGAASRMFAQALQRCSRRGRARRGRERAGHPASGRERGRRLALGVAKSPCSKTPWKAASVRCGELRAGVWLLIGALMLVQHARGHRRAAPRRGARGGRPRAAAASGDRDGAILGLACAYLAITPALAVTPVSRARVECSSRLTPCTYSGASVWVGGVACLFLRCPAATRVRRAASARTAARHARAVLPARARVGGGDRDHRGDPGVHRRAQPRRLVSTTYGL